MTTVFADLGLVLPDHGGASLGQVLPAAADMVGASLTGSWEQDAPAARQRFGLDRASRVCVVLVDGLGVRLLRERAGHAPFMRRLLPQVRELTVGYPATTAASMGLLGTGRGAGLTGLAGYTVRNPRTGGLANLVSWEGTDAPESWQREPTIPRLVADSGVSMTSVGPAKFHGSGLTRAALSGGRYIAAESLDDRVDAAVSALREPGLVYLYWGEVDKTGHHEGWRSAAWGDALAEIDHGLERLARQMPRGSVLLVTADHGMVDVDSDQIVDVAHDRDLAAGVAMVTGEPRAAHVHLEAGADLLEVRERWTRRLEGAAVVLGRDEAIDAQLFGPVAEHVRPMIGDLVVAALGVGGVADTRTQTQQSMRLIGMHGSLTPAEMLVPLLVTQN